jgi:hypothetical protein
MFMSGFISGKNDKPARIAVNAVYGENVSILLNQHLLERNLLSFAVRNRKQARWLLMATQLAVSCIISSVSFMRKVKSAW